MPRPKVDVGGLAGGSSADELIECHASELVSAAICGWTLHGCKSFAGRAEAHSDEVKSLQTGARAGGDHKSGGCGRNLAKNVMAGPLRGTGQASADCEGMNG